MERKNKILVVIDVQEDFARGRLRNDEAIKALPVIHDAVVYANEHFKSPSVLYTLDTHTIDYLKTQEGKNLPVPHCIHHTDGWALCPEAVPDGVTPYTLCKGTFGSMELADRSYGADLCAADEIWICGFCTDICVSANFQILKAAYPEIPIVVIEDACAGVTPELHEAALKVMQSCQARIAKLDELI